jgi:CRISPR-associated endonuclease/helicase Cas3
LADAVVVIDEVHSFDRNMFAALTNFLQNFDVPVLCMTATLPSARQSELEGCGLTPYNEKPGKLQEIAAAARYRLRRVTAVEARDRVQKALDDGRRVLWVVNQVKRAQQAAIALAVDFQVDPRQETLHVRPGVPLFC